MWLYKAIIQAGLLQDLNVVRGDTLRVCEDLGDSLRYCNLVNAQVRVGRDNSASREVDTLAGQVTAEPTLLALQPLAEPPNGFLTHL